MLQQMKNMGTYLPKIRIKITYIIAKFYLFPISNEFLCNFSFGFQVVDVHVCIPFNYLVCKINLSMS